MALEDAWDELHAATPPNWFVGRPGQRHGGQWEQYAFDATEKATSAGAVGSGRRSETEVECVWQMARCLRELGERVGLSDRSEHHIY